MSQTTQTLLLFVGIGIALLTATLIGRLLATQATDSNRNTIINLNDRINAWWVMAALIGIAFIFGKPGVLILFFLVSMLALREFITLLPTRAGDYWALVASFYLVVPLQYLWIGLGWYSMFTVFIPVYAFLLLPILATTGGDTTHFLERAAKIQWGLMISVFCISHVAALMTIDIPGYGGRQLLLIAFLILVVQSSDVLQYVWGKLLGRRKIAPNVSPSKTVEGCIGGIGSATLLGGLLWWITPFSFVAALGMALLIC